MKCTKKLFFWSEVFDAIGLPSVAKYARSRERDGAKVRRLFGNIKGPPGVALSVWRLTAPSLAVSYDPNGDYRI
jgi:hypothetical protein